MNVEASLMDLVVRPDVGPLIDIVNVTHERKQWIGFFWFIKISNKNIGPFRFDYNINNNANN